MTSILKIKQFVLFILIFIFAGSSMIACKDTNKNNSDDGKEEKAKLKGNVIIYVTTTNRSSDFKRDSVDFSATQNMSPSTIALDPTQRFQTMDGFGAAITGSTAYNLLKMVSDDRTKFLKETFSVTEGMGYSYIRVPIGCSDFSLSEYTCCDTKGIENFALTSEENNYLIPILKEILAINPDIKILGSPWTCPRWMKVNNLTDLQPFNSWTSGHLNPAYYSDYATYFVKWIQAFVKAGIPIYSVTPQNEPLNDGNSASLHVEWNEERDFVNNNLVPAFKAAGLKTKIYVYDHNYDDIAYAENIFKGGVDNDVVAGSAWHDYAGTNDALNQVHNAYPAKEVIFTESSIGTWNDGRNLSVRLMNDMQDLALGTVNNWSKAVIVWNLMLDTNGAPNRPGGCNTCYGAVDIDASNYKTITRNSHYYIIGHLASVAHTGATRIGTTGYSPTGVTYSAFENTDGTYAVVLLNNTSDTKKITLDDGENHFSYDVPAHSIVSYLWKK